MMFNFNEISLVIGNMPSETDITPCLILGSFCVKDSFEYNSEINPQLLALEQVKDFLKNTEMMVS